MSDFSSSTITIDAPISEVGATLFAIASYPEWSGAFKKVDVLATDDQGRATKAKLTVDAGAVKDVVTLDFDWSAAPDKVTAGMADDLIEIGINVKSNADAAFKGLNSLNGAVVNSIKSAERLEKNYALLDKAVNKGKITLEQYAKGVQQTDSAIKSLQQRMNASVGTVASYGKHVNQAKGYTNQFGLVTQQVGYQFGDLAVQVQSGTNFFVAFGQQMTQLAGLGAQLSKSMAMIGVFTGLGIAIPILTGILAYMTRTKEETENTVDVFQRLTEATKQLAVERMKLTDPTFDENLQGTKEKLAELTKAYEDAKLAAQDTGLGRFAASANAQAQGEINATKAIVDKAKAQLDAYQQEVGLAKAREMNNARIDAQNEQGLRDLEAKRALGISILSTIVEESKKRSEIARDIGQAYLDTLGIASTNVSSGVDRAAEAARILATNLGISLSAAQNMVNLAANALPMTMAPSDPTGWAENSLGFINPDRLLPPIPSVGVSVGGGGGGGGVSAPSDPLADLMKRIELEKELLGTSEEYQEVMQAIKDSDKQYSDAAIQGAVARLEAINKEKEALQQMESLQQSIAETIGDGFMSMVDGTKTVKEAFRDMARDIIKQLYEVLVIQRLVNGVKTILGGSGLFADGGAFSAGRQIQAYANGGVVGGPTYFPMSGGKTGLMGEAGPEAIMPLKRGKGGKLGVSVEGSSGSVNVVNNINVTGGSDPAAIRAEVAKLMPQITSATKSAVIDARRRGGQMKAAFN
jgi:predicted transcriptional regulator YheO